MAIAFVVSMDAKTTGEDMELLANTAYFGGGIADINPVSITISPGDTLAQVKQKVIEAILAQASSLGYSLTTSDIILPAFQKGG